MSEIKKFEYTGILGWSISRYDKFLNCKRQYFYDYYAKYDKDVPIEKLLFLKSLTSKALETGNIVHDVIRDILTRYKKSTKQINKDKLFKYVFDITKKYCSSKTFFEHYYNGQIIYFDEIYIKVKNILENLLKSQRFAWIEKNAIKQLDKWIIEPDGFGETRINNLKAFCKVDFLFPIEDKVYILDWKTGKADEKKHSKQLLGYAFWASYNFGIKAENIVPIVVYLYPYYTEKNIHISDSKISELACNVEKETKDMYEYLTDIEQNIPKDKKEFSLTSNTFFCKYCNYKEICPGSKANNF
jgi:CRISPR/Cas system-associated exonuclease Cas4 (RecB family)